MPRAQHGSQNTNSFVKEGPQEKILFIFLANKITHISPIGSIGFLLKIYMRILAFTSSYLFWKHWSTGSLKLPCTALIALFSLLGMPGFVKNASAAFWV